MSKITTSSYLDTQFLYAIIRSCQNIGINNAVPLYLERLAAAVPNISNTNHTNNTTAIYYCRINLQKLAQDNPIEIELFGAIASAALVFCCLEKVVICQFISPKDND